MLNIFKRSQNQIVSDTVARIGDAHKASEAAFKVELLMTAREDSQQQLKKVERTQGDMALGAMVMSFGAMALVVAGVTVSLLSPLFLAGLGALALSAGTMFGLTKAVDSLRADRDAIDAKIMQDVKAIADAAPAEAQKSVRYSKSISSFFNIVADAKVDADYAKVSARYETKAPKASSSTSAPYYHDIH